MIIPAEVGPHSLIDNVQLQMRPITGYRMDVETLNITRSVV